MIRYLPLFLALGCATPSPTPSVEGAPAAPSQAGARTDVAVDALAAALPGGAPVVDVRTPGEYAGGHVPGAINVPLQGLDPADPRLEALKGAPVYLICESGRRSAIAADQLVGAGYTVINVEGGTAAWKAAGHPVE